jgi:DivIVA domain-containing protein
MYRFLVLLLVALVVVGAAAYVVGRVDGGEPEPGDRPGDGLPEGRLAPDDLRRARFGVGVRGYRMTEVDAVLERLAGELAARDAELAAVRGGAPVPEAAEAGPLPEAGRSPEAGPLPEPPAGPQAAPSGGGPWASAPWRSAVATADGGRADEVRAHEVPADEVLADAVPDELPGEPAAQPYTPAPRERIAVEAALEAARLAARRAAAAAFPRPDVPSADAPRADAPLTDVPRTDVPRGGDGPRGTEAPPA